MLSIKQKVLETPNTFVHIQVLSLPVSNYTNNYVLNSLFIVYFLIVTKCLFLFVNTTYFLIICNASEQIYAQTGLTIAKHILLSRFLRYCLNL